MKNAPAKHGHPLLATNLLVIVALLVAACTGAPPATPTPAATPGEQPTQQPASEPPGDEIGPPETTSLSLGVRTGNIGSVAPLYIAIDKGYYEEDGLELEVIITDQVQEGLVGGSLQLGIFDPDALAESFAQGVPVVMFAGNRQREPLIIAAGAGIESVEDLEGRDVALGLGPGDPATTFRQAALSEAGWDLETVSVNYVNPPGGSDARAELLWGGQIALTYVFPRHKPQTIEEGGQLVVDDYLDPLLNDAFITTTSFLEANPNTITRFIRATIRGKQIFADMANKDEVLDIMARAGFEVGDREHEQYEADPPQHDIDMAIPQEGYENLMELSGIEDPPGYDELTDLTHLHAAQRSLGLPER